MVIDNQKELEALLNEAAERYDAPDMAQMAEYLVANSVVVLPCEIGDKVYFLVHLDDERTIIDTLTVTEVGQRYIFCSAHVPPRDDIAEEISFDRIGKDVFLSRTDAEMAEKGAIPSEVVEKSSTLHTASFTPHPRGSGLSEEKQIEEMAWDLCDIPKHPSIKSCEQCGNKHCHALYYAERAYNAGYRKQSEVVREIFEEIDVMFRKYYNKCSEPAELKLLEPLCQAERFIINEMWHDVAELKKKYTEGQEE